MCLYFNLLFNWIRLDWTFIITIIIYFCLCVLCTSIRLYVAWILSTSTFTRSAYNALILQISIHKIQILLKWFKFIQAEKMALSEFDFRLFRLQFFRGKAWKQPTQTGCCARLMRRWILDRLHGQRIQLKWTTTKHPDTLSGLRVSAMFRPFLDVNWYIKIRKKNKMRKWFLCFWLLSPRTYQLML